jgi:transcriptional regulator GlxA family with amidase domain
VFRSATGVSIAEFRTKVRLELASTLMNDSQMNLETVAERCGFESARHLRRVWKQQFGVAPSKAKSQGLIVRSKR